MSLAGLGLSLSELAQAKSDPAARPGRAMPSGLEGLQSERSGAADAGAEVGEASVPAGPLDVTLSWPQKSAALSEEDRAAVALAMVLMAEPPSTEPSLGLPEFGAGARWAPSADFARDFEDASASVLATVDLPLASRPSEPTSRISDASIAIESVDVDLDLGVPAVPAVLAISGSPADVDASAGFSDIDVDLSGDVSAAAGPAAAVDHGVDLPLALDLNLDLAPGLDLNLDLAPEVDLRLDRPPVFAVTRLKPSATAAQTADAARLDQAASVVCSADEPLMARQATAPTPQPMEVPAEVAAAAAPRSAQLAQDREGAIGSEAKPTPRVAPTIVVASHADRVMHSLESLLATGDPLTARLGTGPGEVFVTSHAEKALLMLASTCAGESAEPAAEETPLRSNSDPVPAAACKPSANAAPMAQPVRRSPIGDLALSAGDLDRVRGGFETSTGLKISFGIERAVYINGSLVTTTSLNVSELGKVTGGAGAISSAVAGSSNLTLIQNGPGNTFVSGPVSSATLGTVVQNTLNDQKIQSVTAVNATVNSLQLVRAQNFQSSLRGAIIDSLRR